ncbi:MAG: DNA polymerase III subunit gamma/tau [bacterium]
MQYLSLYRKWRPNNLAELKGQDAVVRTLTNALEQKKIAHAYLFSGPRGTGKTSTAKIIAACLNCASGVTASPCGECECCRKIKAGYFLDVLEIDAASNRGIDEIRDLREKVKFLPTEGRYKVYIIDEVHMLTTEAFNALLKTLEEPPEHVVFILATTEQHKIPATILSRCQCFDFKPVALSEMTEALADIASKEGFKVDAASLHLLARSAQGGMRDALGLLDQAAAFAGGNIRLEDVNALLGLADGKSLFLLADLVCQRDEAGVLQLIQSLVEEGHDLQQFIKGAVEHFRSLLFFKLVTDPKAVLQLTEEEFQPLQKQSLQFRKDELTRILKILFSCQNEIKYALNVRWSLEFYLLQLCDRAEYLSHLEQRVSALEKLLENKDFSGLSAVKPADVREAGDISQTEPPPAEVSEDYLAEEEALPADQEAVPAADFSTEELEEIWPLLLEKVKKKKRTYHAYLSEGKLKGIKDGQIRLSFPKKFSFHKENAERPEVKALIKDILLNDFHKNASLVCLEEGEEEAKDEKREKKPVSKNEHSLLQKTLAAFQGEIIEKKRSE